MLLLSWLFMSAGSKHDLKVLKASFQVTVWRADLEIQVELLNQMSQWKKQCGSTVLRYLISEPDLLRSLLPLSNFLTGVNWFCSHDCSFSRFSWSYQRKRFSAVAMIWRIPIPWFRQQVFISSHLLFWRLFLVFISRLEQRTIVLHMLCICS